MVFALRDSSRRMPPYHPLIYFLFITYVSCIPAVYFFPIPPKTYLLPSTFYLIKTFSLSSCGASNRYPNNGNGRTYRQVVKLFSSPQRRQTSRPPCSAPPVPVPRQFQKDRRSGNCLFKSFPRILRTLQCSDRDVHRLPGYEAERSHFSFIPSTTSSTLLNTPG